MGVKRLSTRFACLLLLALLPLALPRAWAATDGYFTEGAFRYHIQGGQEVEVVQNPAGYTGDIVIPATATDPDDGKVYNVTAVGREAFYENSEEVTSMELPASVNDIGSFAFSGCLKLAAYRVVAGNDKFFARNGVLFAKYDNNDISLYEYPRAKTGESYAIPDDVRGVSNDAFFANLHIKRITMGDKLEYMGDGAFQHCKNLRKMELGRGVKQIVSRVFYNVNEDFQLIVPTDNPHLKMKGDMLLSKDDKKFVYYLKHPNKTAGHFEVPEGIEIVNNDVLNNTHFSSIGLPASLRVIGNFALLDMSALTKFTLAAGNQHFEVRDGVLFKKKPNGSLTLFNYPRAKPETSYTVPDGVTEIWAHAINESQLEEITLPRGLKRLAFVQFWKSPKLKTIHLNADLEKIEYSAFQDLPLLETLTLGPKLEQMGEDILGNCGKLKTLTCLGKNPNVGGSLGSNLNSLEKIYVPQGSLEAYQVAAPWEAYKDKLVAIEQVTNPASLTLEVGASAKVGGSIAPAELGANTWRSLDPSVATVTVHPSDPAKATVEGKAPGYTWVVFEGVEGLDGAVCQVTVSPAGAPSKAVTGVQLAEGSAPTVAITERVVYVNEVLRLVPIIAPADASNRAVAWEKSDDPERCLSVSNGEVMGLKPTSAPVSVRVRTLDGNHTAEVAVTVRARPTKIVVTADPSEVEAGGTAQCSVTVEPTGADEDVTWSSADEDIATVDANTGLVTAKKAGKVKITATSKADPSVKGEVELTVKAKPKPTSITVKADPSEVEAGGTAQCSVTVEPAGADESVTWASGDEDIATVDASTGLVTTKKAGTVKITATSVADPSVKGEVELTVKEKSKVKPTSITVTADPSEVEAGGTAQCNVTVEPAGADESVTWSSGDENIATVDASTGLVTTKKAGKVKITATSKADPSVKGEVTVTVKEKSKAKPTSITVRVNPSEVEAGGTAQCSVTVEPAGADESVTWASGDEDIATVDASTGLVTTKKAGKVKITASSVADPSVKGEVTVTVKPAGRPKPDPTSVEVAADRKEVWVGETLQCTATVKPAGADQRVTWASGAEDIATVDANTGKVTTKKAGTVKITASSVADPSVKGEVELTVKERPAPTKVIIARNATTDPLTTLELFAGDQAELIAIVKPDEADQQVSWATSEPYIVEVNNGRVVAKKVTTSPVTITVTTMKGGISTRLSVTVKAKPRNQKPRPTSIVVKADPGEVEVGGTAQCSATVEPTGAEADVTWSSGDEDIATVDASGKVMAKKAGTVKITATSKADPSVKGEVELTVKEKASTEDQKSGQNSGQQLDPKLSSPVSTVGAKTYSLWPNPASSWVRVKGLERDTQVGIFNLLGVKVAELPLPVSGELDLGFLPRGRYILRVDGVSLRLVKE